MATPSEAASSSGPWGSTVKISVGRGSLHASRDHGEAAAAGEEGADIPCECSSTYAPLLHGFDGRFMAEMMLKIP